MPELPEVERARRRVEKVARGKTIRHVQVADDPIVMEAVPPRRVRAALTGRRVEAVWRWGKHLWVELDRPPAVLFHLGMTGSFEVPGGHRLPLATGPRPGTDGWPPRFTKLRLEFDDGSELAFTNARRLGRIRLRRTPREEEPLRSLGFDPYLALPVESEFRRLVQVRSATLKGLLLDQGFAAGVGNWIADEVLYQARLDPRRRGNELSVAEVRRLRSKLRHVIRFAVEVDADKARFPRSWLFHHRWGKDEDARTARGERVEFLKLAGRTTAWVPEVQA